MHTQTKTHRYMSSVMFFICFDFPPSSHNKLGHLLCTQVQREVLVGSFDGKRVLVITDTNPLFCHSLVTIAKLLHTTKCVTVGRVLWGLHPLWGIPLVQTDIIQWLAVPVCGVLRFPAWHHLNNKYKQQTEQIRINMCYKVLYLKMPNLSKCKYECDLREWFNALAFHFHHSLRRTRCWWAYFLHN